MPRDYKNSGKRPAATKTAASSGLPGWFCLLIGLGLGLGVATAVHFYHTVDAPPGLLGESAGPGVAKPETAEAEPPERPRFEFYKLLPEMQVTLPEQEQAPKREQAAPPVTTQPAPIEPGARYLLQAGSFQSFNDADRMKAQLALLGVEATIQTVEIRGGETWHRVRIGPFSDSERLNDVRQRLQSNGIESILLQLSS